MGNELKSREEKILKWLIRDHTISGQPIGSPRLVEMDYFRLSSASIRSVLHGLELAGYLKQPHTSSGRIPTDKGYRYFVDRLMEARPPSETLVREYESEVSLIGFDLDTLIKSTAQFLGDVSHALILMSTPRQQIKQIKSLALHELDRSKVLLIVNTNLDQVQTIAFEFESDLSRLVLKEAELILNDLFAGLDLEQIHELTHSRQTDSARKNPLVKEILNQVDRLFYVKAHDTYQVYGTHHLLHYQEMTDPRIMELLLESLETDDLQKQLPVPLDIGRPHILIGNEHGLSGLTNLSLVSIAYEGQEFTGDIHFIGPTRMPYEEVVSLAAFTADKMKSII